MQVVPLKGVGFRQRFSLPNIFDEFKPCLVLRCNSVIAVPADGVDVRGNARLEAGLEPVQSRFPPRPKSAQEPIITLALGCSSLMIGETSLTQCVKSSGDALPQPP